MNWEKIKTKQKHKVAKNKNLEAALITKDNVAEVEKETGVFTYLKDRDVIIAGLGFYRLPQWLICLNPKSHKEREYILESDGVFQNYFEIVEETEKWKNVVIAIEKYRLEKIT